jgi:molybdopterin/thiamine biosynthesis adenylyltransferase
MPGELSDKERERYSRRLSGMEDEAGQLRLRDARALVVGAGGTGSIAAAYLAAGGVGYVGIADDAVLALADLPGEPLQLTPDVGALKAEALAAKLGFQNLESEVDSYPVRVDEANAYAIVDGFDVVLDCTGEPGAADLLARTCTELGAPLVAAVPEPGHSSGLARVPAAGITGARAAADALELLERDRTASGAGAGERTAP